MERNSVRVQLFRYLKTRGFEEDYYKYVEKEDLKCCGNCKWSTNRSLTPTGRFQRDKALQCEWPIPPQPTLALSIRRWYGFKYIGCDRSWMQPTDTGCPTWESEVKP